MLLEVRNLRIHYGKVEAVKGVSLGLERGQIITLIGANGAGKSSILNAISGLVKPSAGKSCMRVRRSPASHRIAP